MPQPDDRIIDLLNDLQACLCSELTPEGQDTPILCLCIPIPGAYPAQALIGVGDEAAWVRLVDYFPSNTPGVQLQAPYSSTFANTALIEMGVLRCHEVPERGVYYEQLLTSMFTRQMRDLGAMQRALQCCTGKSWDENQFVVGNYRPMGPEGDVFGGLMSIAIQVE